jgi:hypothetical protein
VRVRASPAVLRSLALDRGEVREQGSDQLIGRVERPRSPRVDVLKAADDMPLGWIGVTTQLHHVGVRM